MAKRNSNTPRAKAKANGKAIPDGWIPVVAYYRMSTDDQDDSIEQQRIDVRAYCKRMKYSIVREYIDSGKSGSKDHHKRVDYHQMIRDAGKKNFELIIVWRMNRFGRMGAMESVPDKLKLKRAGVDIEDTAGKRTDWWSMGGQVVDTVQAANDREKFIEIATGTLRGRIKATGDGKVTSRISYAMCKVIVDDQGNEREYFWPDDSRTPGIEGWKSYFKPGRKEQVDAVKFLFANYKTRKVNRSQLARECIEKGYPAPGKRWDLCHVTDILRRHTYAGDNLIGVKQSGKFAVHQAGKSHEIERDAYPEPTAPTGKRDAWVTDKWEAIIPREDFDAVQEKLDRETSKGRKPSKSGRYPFSSFVYCDHCKDGLRSQPYGAGGKLSRYGCKSKGANRSDCPSYTIG